ncbi:MAG TPA: phenylalanine--tRNA ligase subunit beta [Kofleriaceae bacterium]|jgi:phenylalanyl-tRNA synthetase beta chain
MRVLWSWLVELCDLDTQPTPAEGAAALTRAGIEIEGIEDLGKAFSGVVVAEVVAKRPHPSADKLTLVDVITERNGTATQVVCGASNVPEAGRRVLWAQIGAKLPSGITLAAKAVKGIESPGMLCAEDELGLSQDHAGIIVLPDDDRTPLGAPAQQALGLADHVLEVSAPANRGDVLGHLGVARELCAMLGGKIIMPDADLSAFGGASGPHDVDIAIDSPDACARYVGGVIAGLSVRPSPARIQQRLRAVGVRAISSLVDVTNYVMFELGQPLHAFDADTIKSAIRVGFAGEGEQFQTLDGVTRMLGGNDLLIHDGATPIALAGVMGGAATEVKATTTRVLLEAASFQALLVRRTAKRLNLPSEASLRFGRGVDPELAGFAWRRAAALLCRIARDAGDSPTVPNAPRDAYPGKRTIDPIRVRLSRVQRITGVALDATACTAALERLGCAVQTTGDALTVTPPSARADLTREVDVIEEIIRVHGYEHVPSTLPALREAPGIPDADRADAARAALAAAGASEAITYGFQSADRCASLGLPGSDRRSQPIAIKNPMSGEQAVMRTSLLPNLGAAIARNQSFGRGDVCIFEVGSVFLRRGEGMSERPMHELADEPVWAAGVIAGKRAGRIGDGPAWDVFDAKALALETIRAVAGPIAVRTLVASVPYLHPGVAGALAIDDIGTIGWFGELHPDVRAKLGIVGKAFAFEVDLDALPIAPPAAMHAIAKYPGSDRDVSLLLAEAIPAARVQQVIADAKEPLIAGVRLLEDYRDAKLGAGNKSMLWSIAYRSPERTLTIAEVDKAHEQIVRRLVEQLPAQQR